MMKYIGGNVNGTEYDTMIDVNESFPIVKDNCVAVLGRCIGPVGHTNEEATIESAPAMLVFNTDTQELVDAVLLKSADDFDKCVKTYNENAKEKSQRTPRKTSDDREFS